MIATFIFTFTNINLAGRAAPVRRARELPDSSTTSGPGLARRSPLKFAADGAARGVILPFAVALLLQLAPPPRRRARSGCCSSCRMSCRSWPASYLEQMLNPDTGWINGVLPPSASSDPPDWLQDTTWIYPGLVIVGSGGSAARSSSTWPGSRAPDRAVRRGPDRRCRCGPAAPHHAPDDVAGHLLLAGARRRRGAPVLPRPARPQERDRASRAARRSSSTSTSTRTSSRSRTCPTARRSPGSSS